MPELEPEPTKKGPPTPTEAAAQRARIPTAAMVRPDIPPPNPSQPDTPDRMVLPGAPQDLSSGSLGAQAVPSRPRPTVGERVANFISGGQSQSPGSVWRGILGGVLTGMAAGAGEKNAGAAVAAGARAAGQQRQQIEENQFKRTREEEESQYRKAQIAHLNQETLHQTLLHTEAKNKAATEWADRENAWNTRISEDKRNQIIGNFRNMDDIYNYAQTHPELASWQAKGEISLHPHTIEEIGPDGKGTGTFITDGVVAAHVNPDWLKQKIDKDVTIPHGRFVPGAKSGDPGTYEDVHYGAGTVTNEQVNAAATADSKDAAKYENDAAEMRAQALMMRAITQRDKPQTGFTPEQIDDLGRLIAGDPIHFSLKMLTNTRKDERGQVFLKAVHYNPNFKPMQAELAYGTFQDFLQGDTNKQLFSANAAMRHLKLYGEAMQGVQNGETTKLNELANEFNLKLGSDTVSNVRIVNNALASEAAAVYKGFGTPSDPEIKLFHESFEDALNPAQARGAITTTARLIGDKIQDKYRTFANATGGRTPEQEGITVIQPDVQEFIRSLGLSPIAPGGPPVPIQQGAAGGAGGPGGGPPKTVIPPNAQIHIDPVTKKKGYTTPDMKPGTWIPIIE